MMFWINVLIVLGVIGNTFIFSGLKSGSIDRKELILFIFIFNSLFFYSISTLTYDFIHQGV